MIQLIAQWAILSLCVLVMVLAAFMHGKPNTSADKTHDFFKSAFFMAVQLVAIYLAGGFSRIFPHL